MLYYFVCIHFTCWFINCHVVIQYIGFKHKNKKINSYQYLAYVFRCNLLYIQITSIVEKARQKKHSVNHTPVYERKPTQFPSEHYSIGIKIASQLSNNTKFHHKFLYDTQFAAPTRTL